MSNFWSRKLAEMQPAPPPRQQPATSPQGPWWASARPAQPPAQITGTPFGGGPAINYNPDPNLPPGHHVITPDEMDMRKVASIRQQSDECPQCSGHSYFAPTGTNRKRCWECGYPVVHSTSGMNNTSARSGQPGQAARQIANMTITDTSGHVVGQVPAASGVTSNYYPQNTSAGSPG